MSISIEDDAIEAIVRIGEEAHRARARAPRLLRSLTATRRPRTAAAAAGTACTSDPRPVHSVETPFEAMLPKLVALTSSQIAVGRAGNRFRTDLYLRVREGHADARDAVHSEVPARLARAARAHFARDPLPRPARVPALSQPRAALDDDVARHVEAYADTRPTCRSSWATGSRPTPSCRTARPRSRPAQAALARGAAHGRGVLREVRAHRRGRRDRRARGRARHGDARGRAPGARDGRLALGFYIAINPKLDQDNAEKNCISNVRPIGIAPRGR
jgi:ethanolamine ammonia-lyase small subunit